MRTAAWEAAPQVALRDLSTEAVGGSQYIRLWWRGEFNTIKHSFYKRFSASPASLVAQLVKNPPAVHEWSCLVVSDFVTPWPVACQAPPSMGFSRQEYWSGLLLPSPGDLPDPGMEPKSPALQANTLPPEPSGKLSSIPGLGRSPGEGKPNPLFWHGKSMDYSPVGHKELDTNKRLWFSLFCLSGSSDVTMKRFSTINAFLDMRRYKYWNHEISSWKYPTIYRPVPPGSLEHRMPRSTLNFLRECWSSTAVAPGGSVSSEADGKCPCGSVADNAREVKSLSHVRLSATPWTVFY